MTEISKSFVNRSTGETGKETVITEKQVIGDFLVIKLVNLKN